MIELRLPKGRIGFGRIRNLAAFVAMLKAMHEQSELVSWEDEDRLFWKVLVVKPIVKSKAVERLANGKLGVCIL